MAGFSASLIFQLPLLISNSRFLLRRPIRNCAAVLGGVILSADLYRHQAHKFPYLHVSGTIICINKSKIRGKERKKGAFSAPLAKPVRIIYTQTAFISYCEQITECFCEVSYPRKYQYY